MKLSTLWISALAFSVIAGCDDEGGGGDSLNGVYEVTSHTLSADGCDDSQPVESYDMFGHFYMLEQPFFVVQNESFFGVSVKTIEGCDAAEPCPESMDEDSFGGGGQTFVERQGDAWVTNAVAAGGSPIDGGPTFNCTVTRTYAILEATEGGVRATQRIEKTESFVAQTEDECFDYTDNPPEDRLSCDSLEIIEAAVAGAGDME